MRKKEKVILLSVTIVFAVLLIIGFLFHNEIRSLSTLTMIDNHPMYQMTYYGDYGFDDFLKIGANSDSDIENFVTQRLLKGLPINLGVTGDGCTAFVAKNEKGEIIFGRNFDFDFAPSLQVFTAANNGFKSVSTVNLSYAGYSEDNLPDGLSANSFLTLSSPFLPFDGMNEKGLAIALLAVPEIQYTPDANKVTLNTTTAIRLVLDQAANVDEAVELLRSYNIYFSGDIYCHYLIADAQGNSVIVEYWDGELQTIKPSGEYQIASNFIVYNDLNIGDGYCEFERYNIVDEKMRVNNGILTEEEAIKLLTEVGVYFDGEDRLQWSVLYNLTTLEGKIFAGRNTDNVIEFQFD
ncbi:linear amide C-N hydrolase [Natronospora cellulosivora (SeqCode)]